MNFDLKISKIRKLSLAKNNKNFQELLGFLKDKNEIIRIETLEGLYNQIDYLNENDLKDAFKDKSPLVRAYTLELYAQLTKSEKKVLEKINKDRSSNVKLSGYSSLYLLGHKNYLENIIELMLKTKQYRIRSASVKTLASFTNKNNFRTILNPLMELRKKEDTVAVSSTLEKVIKSIQKKYEISLKNPRQGNML